jgi:hypothetical protein
MKSATSVLDPNYGQTGKTSTKAFAVTATDAQSAIGVVSTNPYIDVLGEALYADNEHAVPVGVSGRVPVRVNNENGAIVAGDRITLSSTPGVGTKAINAGRIIGTAMSDFSGSGEGLVTMFIEPGFWMPSISDSLQSASASFGSLDVTGSASIGDLNVSGASTLQSLTVAGDTTLNGNLSVAGTTAVADLYVKGKLISKGPVPIITNGAALSGVLGASTSVSGTDGAGTVQVTIGANVPAGGELAEVQFDSAYTTPPRIVISGNNKESAKLGAYVTRTTTGFKIVNDDALNANTTYSFDYVVIGAEN